MNKCNLSMSRVTLAMTILMVSPSAFSAGKWNFEVTPYLWAISQAGKTGNQAIQADFDASTNDIFSNLDGGILLDFEAQNDNWGIKFDTVYMDIAKGSGFVLTENGPGGNADLEVEETVLTGSVFYKPMKPLQLHLGARYVDLNNRLDLKGNGSYGISKSIRLGDSWTEAIAGVKYTLLLTEDLVLVAYGDIGGFTGQSDSMYQLAASLEYQITDLLNIKAGYRILDVDYNTSSFIFDAKTEGMTVGLGFNF
jgi:opacity protein-like surface antigen